MDRNSESIEAAQRAAESFHKRTSSPPPKRGIYQFFSFDIRGSTAYKAARIDWPLLVERFYEFTWDRLRKDDNQFRFWKHVGDEILAFRQIGTLQDAWDATEHAHRVLGSVIDSLLKEFPNAHRERLSIKAASWVAGCIEIKSMNTDAVRQQFEESKITDLFTKRSYYGVEDEIPDFLGPNIDGGFRIAKNSAPGVVVLSLELAHLLGTYKAETPRNVALHEPFRIVGFESLKGIWRERPYPIIWYCPKTVETAFKYFSYDDHLELESFKNQFEDNATADCGRLKSIAEDVGVYDSLESIEGVLTINTELADKVHAQAGTSEVYSPTEPMEVHCVAVCYRKADKKVLVARRLETRRVLPDTWEFGCAKLQEGKAFFDSMQSNYKAVFGIDIEFPHESQEPVNSFFIKEKSVPGVIFAASVIDATSTRINEGKHSEFKWITLEEARKLTENQKTVANFLESIERSIERFAPG